MEVSNKALNAYFDGIESKGDSVESFLSGTSFNEEDLRNQKGRISWEEFRILTVRFAAKYPDYLTIIAQTGITNKVIKPFFDTLTYFVSYNLVYQLFLQLSFKLLYKNVKVETSRTGLDSFRIVFKFDDRNQIFPEFIEMYMELFKVVPVNFLGCAVPSKVDYELSENKIIFYVKNLSFAKLSIPNFLYNVFFSRKKYHELILKNVEYSNLLEQQNQELESYRLSLESLNNELNLVNRTLNHDIANKMLTLELAKKLIHDGRHDEAVGKINRFATSVKGIIHNSRSKDLSKKERFEMNSVNLYELLLESLIDHEDMASQKGIRLIHEFYIDKALEIKTNKIALQNNLIANILHNAVKFSNRGGSIVFSASMKDGLLSISIVDFGVGIAEKKLELIKQNIGVISSTRGTSGEKGTGVGMGIILDTANALGFKVDIKSTISQGTSIELTREISVSDVKDKDSTEFKNVSH